MATINDPRFRGNSTTPEEREVATADVACKNQVNLIGTWFTADTASQKELNAQKESDFAMALKAKSEEQKQPTGSPRPGPLGPGPGRAVFSCAARAYDGMDRAYDGGPGAHAVHPGRRRVTGRIS
ncbi:hypothetical protein [Streptomyces cinnamoneus]|uniref:hypothetical protein n=1 Tax=Streptomyces cinnamoneus TaxID=53446 RepID=UPI001865A2F7|nr:hypothetical protein [Streptomyces cinnamoneus]